MLLTDEDLNPAINIDLTDPNGQELANLLIATTQALISCSANLDFRIEQTEISQYENPEFNRCWHNTTAPISDLVAANRDINADSYDTNVGSLVIDYSKDDEFISTGVLLAR